MRQRSQTIGALGRVPARTSGVPRAPSQAPPPPSEPQPQAGQRIRAWLHGALFENMGLKFLSLVLAATVFLLVNTDEAREITVRVGVKYEYPADKVLVSQPLDEVRATVRGPWRRLRHFDEREIERITLDLHSAPSGEIAITPDMITNLPPGLEVTSVSPRAVRVAFDKRVEKVIEVVPLVTGRPLFGYVVDEVKSVPPTIRVRGGERVIAALTSVRTAEVSVEGRGESFEQLAELVVPEGVTLDPTQRIGVQVRIKEELVTRKFADVPVVIGGEGVDPSKWAVVPAMVEVTLTGPRLDVEAAKNTMTATATLAPGMVGRREIKVSVDGVKGGVGVKISPERVKVGPARPNAPP